LSHPKPRPAIVASIDPINDLCPDVILTYPCYDEARPFKNSFVIQSVITSHTCVAPRFIVEAYSKNTPHSSPSSLLGLLCSDALYAALFMLLCIEDESATGLKQKSYAKCESIGPIHKSRLKKKIGEIPGNEWPMIENGIKRVLGLE